MSARAAASRSRPVMLPGVRAIAASRWLDPALLVGVLAIAFAVYAPAAARVGYNTDEGQFIAASGYFDVVFRDRSVTGPLWEPNYYLLTQPMLSRLIIGGAIRWAGQTPPPVDIHHREAEVSPATRGRYLERETYRDERRIAEERRIDRPVAPVLQAARGAMVLLAILGTGLMYLTGRLIGGRVAGLVAAGIALASPTMLTLLPRAHAEAPLYFATLAALLLGLLAASSAPARRSLWLGAACGVMVGLAISVKLTGILLVAALLTYAGLAFLLWLPGRSLAAAVAWRWSMLASVLAIAVMVALNPFLYRDPVGRLQDMLAFRQQEMFGQAVLGENEAVAPGLRARMPLLLERTLTDLATLNARLGAPLDVPLLALGLLTLSWRIARRPSAEAALGPDALLLICCLVVPLGLGWNLGIDWARYYMPMLTLAAVLIGLGTGALAGAVRAIARAT